MTSTTPVGRSQTRAQFLDVVDSLAKTVEDVIRSLRTTTHEYLKRRNLDEQIPDDLLQGRAKESVLPVVSDYLDQTKADVSLGFSDFNDSRTPADPVARNTAYFPHTCQRWLDGHYQKKQAVDEEVAELERDLRTYTGRRLEASAAKFTPSGSPRLDLERQILSNGTLLPLLQKTRAELYRRAGVDEKPLLLYQLCFQKVLEEKGWKDLADAELVVKLQEEQVALEVFEEFTGRKLVKAAPAASSAPATALSVPAAVAGIIIEELSDRYRLHGVSYQGNIHVIDWNKQLLRDGAVKTQDDWIAATQDSEWKLPDFPLSYASMRHLYHHRQHADESQKRLAEQMKAWLREQFDPQKPYIVSSTRICYAAQGNDTVIHRYGYADSQQHSVAITGPNGYITATNRMEEVLEALFSTRDGDEVKAICAWVTGHNPYLWRLNSRLQQNIERAGLLGCGSVRFGVVASDYLSNRRPALGVVVYPPQGRSEPEASARLTKAR